MQVTRLDLDGTGSPSGLVTKILKAEPNLKIPVPIEELAYQLGIGEINELKTEAFEGCPITDQLKSVGGILVRRGTDPRRKRFTIGHELGHFLIPFHKPNADGKFLCSRADMMRWSAAEKDTTARMEAEANQFSALILMPPPHLTNFLSKTGDPDLNKILAVHEHYEISKEAAARAYALYHEKILAIVMVRNAKILRVYAGPKFPRLSVWNGQSVPPNTNYHTVLKASQSLTTLRQIGAEHWLETEWGKPSPELYEQVHLQTNGFAMIML